MPTNQTSSWHGLRMFATASGVAALFLAFAVAPGEPNIVAGLASLGVAVALSQLGASGRVLSALAAAIAAGIGVIRLAEYAFGPYGVFDQLLFADPSTPIMPLPARPLPLSGSLLLLLGTGLLCPGSHQGWRHVRTACALVSLVATWVLLNDHWLGGLESARALSSGPVVAAITTALFLSALGTLASQPGHWPTSAVLAVGTGGVVCRWLLPAVLGLPVLAWILRYCATFQDPRSGACWTLYAVLSSAVPAGVVLAVARRIDLLESERASTALLSLHDPLTGLPNRRAFDSFLLESFNKARRHRLPLSLLTVDVDNFKSYNDTYGHVAGDEVLKLIAMTFTGVARNTDLVARIGGEEFALVLPETDAIGALKLAERVREEIAALALFPRLVTVSVGVATLSSRTSTAVGLLKESGSALFSAKQAGRDRVATGARALTS